MRVAVIGTGAMGTGIVHSLLRAGLDVTVWNRHIERAATLERDGATLAESPPDAVGQADVVITTLFDEAAVTAAADRFLDAMPATAIWMQTATVGPAGARRLAELAASHGVAFIDAPVVGTKQPAEEGTLVVLISGPDVAVRTVAPVVEAIGSKSVKVGNDPGGASGLKLACNAWIASITAGVAQSLQMCRALEIDPRLFLAVIDGGPSNAPYAQLKGDMMIDEEFAPSFTIDGIVKDLHLMAEDVQQGSESSLLLSSVRELFEHASAIGHGREDVAAVSTALR